MSQKKSDNFNNKILTQDEIQMVSGGAIWIPIVIGGVAAAAGLGYWGIHAFGKALGKAVASHGTYGGGRS